MVGPLDERETAFLELATKLRSLDAVRVVVTADTLEVEWAGAPVTKAASARPLEREERAELDHLRGALRREEEAMSAS
ncbi:MAG: hypothetical protein O7B23_10805 [Deltaproteobacteria bacterium]|nr:hypothetical protein [Deltaproteobacteria bacterium]